MMPLFSSLFNIFASVMNPAVLERSDTDASSVGPRVPPITAVQTTGTLDDNSADHGTLNAPASISQKPPQGTQAPTTASVGNNGLPNDSGVVPAGQTTGVSQSMANTPSLVVGRNSELHGRGTERTVANPDTVLFWRYQCPMTKVSMIQPIWLDFHSRTSDLETIHGSLADSSCSLENYEYCPHR